MTVRSGSTQIGRSSRRSRPVGDPHHLRRDRHQGAASRHRLQDLGLSQGDPIGTFAWNNRRHHELYWATANTGLVCHTVNIRLFADQIAYIVNHAGDRVLFVDPDLAPLLGPITPELKTVETFVVMGEAARCDSGIDRL